MIPVQPLGHHVLIEIIPVKFKSEGGILLASENEKERERKGRDLGKIVAFGPTAYKGFEGCESPADWGVAEGDIVELSGRYDGKFSSVSEYDNSYKSLRYVMDNDIIGLFSKDMAKHLIQEN
jgi:co-chaperonin GroES (HSP10)